jgi:hypothetical protein
LVISEFSSLNDGTVVVLNNMLRIALIQGNLGEYEVIDIKNCVWL